MRWDGPGLARELGFTLLALPVLARHGPWVVSAHTTWIAAIMFGVVGVATEGPAALLRLTAGQVLAVAYLAVAVTALAFVLWYHGVHRLGAGRAGLLAGVAPLSATATGAALGGPAPSPAVLAGIVVVVAGLAPGLRSGPPPVTSGPPVASTSRTRTRTPEEGPR